MSELNYPNATAELAQILGVEGKEHEIDDFLSNWAVLTTQRFISFMPSSWTGQEILDATNDVYKVGDVMDYGMGEEEEEEDDESEEESPAEPPA